MGLATVEKWMPGEIELFTEEFFEQPADLPPGQINDVADTIRLPDDLPPGTYKLSIAVVGEDDTEPVVQLGIEGPRRGRLVSVEHDDDFPMREKGLAMSGAVVVIHQNRLMQPFRDAKATDPKSAITLADIGCRNSWIFRRMVARGVFIETGKARYYMDEDAARGS